jgi:thymidylate synthase
MNKLDKQYTELLQYIIDKGVKKDDRTGTGTISVFGRQIRHNMKDGFPLLTTKKMPFKIILTELLWFLNGDTNIKYLVDNNCHIWDGDAYKNYCKQWSKYPSEGNFTNNEYTSPTKHEAIRFTQNEFINKIKTDDEFAKNWGELGPIYGKQWRSWKQKDVLEYGYKEGEVLIDQIQNLINELKTNPDSRRLIVNAWNVGELDKMVLPPCHYGFQIYTRELSFDERVVLANKPEMIDDKHYTDNAISELTQLLDENNIPTRAISLMWNQRSVDTALGLPFNIASYALLLEIIGKIVNMVPDELIGNLGDVHLYSNHLDGAKEQIGRELSLEERNDLLNTEINENHKRENCFSDEEFERETLQDCKVFNIPKRTREPFPLPTLKHLRSDDKYTLLTEFPSLWSEIKLSDFEIENYQSHSKIDFPLSN